MREILNRVFTIIFSLLVLACTVVILLVATGATSENILPYDWWSGQLLGVAEADGGDEVIAIAVSIILILGAGTILVLQLLPSRKPLLCVHSDESGALNIDGRSVCVLSEKVGSEVEGVKLIKFRVSERPDGITLSSDVLLSLGSDIMAATSELQQRIKQSVEKLIGLTVAQVIINAHYETVTPAGSKTK